MKNHAWHRDNPVPIFPRSDFLGWHLRHEASCGCRPVPPDVLQEFALMGFILAGHPEELNPFLAHPPRLSCPDRQSPTSLPRAS